MQAKQRDLPQVFWIGGAPDSGKSTTAKIIAERRRCPIYHYDRRDQAHLERLALTEPYYRDFLDASLDERWVFITPEELFHRWLQTSIDRFPLVIDDLLATPGDNAIIAEGFGLLPQQLAPLLAQPFHAIWLVPTEAFKQASMINRGKPSFSAQVSNAEKAKQNILQRDRLIANYIRNEAKNCNLTLFEVGDSSSINEVIDTVERIFSSSVSQSIGKLTNHRGLR